MITASLLGIFILGYSSLPYLKAASLVEKVANPNGEIFLARIGQHSVQDAGIEFPSSTGPVEARIYRPTGVTDPPGMVIVHGVHHLGMAEPRLVAFSRAMAASGILVLTPEVGSLADYHVAPEGVAVIGESAGFLARNTRHPVGVMGLSFAGGLALLAGADERYVKDIAFVFAVGAHDDLARVGRFYANDVMQFPDGSGKHMPAHEYGPLVLIYDHPEDFFPANDAPIAAKTIQLQLYEQTKEAAKESQRLSAGSLTLMSSILKQDRSVVRDRLLREIEARKEEMAAVSPRGRLGRLHVSTFLLHGAGDDVIPPSETLWLQREIPPEQVRAVLISKAISHVQMEGDPSWRDRFALISFMEKVLREENRIGAYPE